MIPLDICHPGNLVWVTDTNAVGRTYHLYQRGLEYGTSWRWEYPIVIPMCGARAFRRVSHIPWKVRTEYTHLLEQISLCYECIVVVCRTFPEIFDRKSTK